MNDNDWPKGDRRTRPLAYKRFVLTATLLIIITVGAIYSLVSGAPYLETPLPGGLPIGNVIAAVAFIAPAGAALALSRPGTWLRRFAATSFLVALAWLPMSIVLAGNLELNFNGSGGFIWMNFTLAIALAAFGVLAWALISRLFRGRIEETSRHGS